MTVYENIAKLCDRKGMSIRQLEIKSGVANGTVGKFRKSQSVRYSTLQKLATALGVKPDTLMKEKE